MNENKNSEIEIKFKLLTPVAIMLSRSKSIVGLTAANFIDKNWNQKVIQSHEVQVDVR